MRLWRRSKALAELPAPDWADRREPVRWCASCRTGAGPFIYLENGKHYCRACARRAGDVMRLRPAGRRTDDLKAEDLKSA
jgi:hypothetical protein